MFDRLLTRFSEGRSERRLRRLKKELSRIYSVEQSMADISALMIGKRTSNDVLEELVAILTARKEIAATLTHFGFVGPAAKTKLVDLFWELSVNGAGMGATDVPLAALYDHRLLGLLLKAKADNISPTKVAGMAFDYCVSKRVGWVSK